MTDFFARTAHHRAVSECFLRKTPRYNGQAHDDRYCALSHFSTSGRHLIFGLPPIAHYSANPESAKRNSCSGGNGHGDRESVTIVPNARRLRASRSALGIESSICCDRALQALCGSANGTGNGEIINYILQDHAIPSSRKIKIGQIGLHDQHLRLLGKWGHSIIECDISHGPDTFDLGDRSLPSRIERHSSHDRSNGPHRNAFRGAAR